MYFPTGGINYFQPLEEYNRKRARLMLKQYRYKYKDPNTNRSKEVIKTNGYINLNRLHNTDELDSLYYGNDIVSTNIENYESFSSDLKEYTINNNFNNTDTEKIVAVSLECLLESEANIEYIDTIIDKIMDRYDNLPYFAWVKKEGKGIYLCLSICERYYYPSGKEFIVLAKNDIYENIYTHKRCKSTDPDAVVVKYAGDVLRSYVSKFSKKTDFFKFKKNCFEKVWNEFKLWFIEMLKSVCDTTVIVGMSFKKYVLRGKTKKTRNAMRKWNSALEKIEDNFNDAVTGLMNCDLYNKSNKGILDTIIADVNKIIYDGHFNYTIRKKHKPEEIKISSIDENGKTRFYYNQYINDYTDALIEVIQGRINNAMNNIMNQA